MSAYLFAAAITHTQTADRLQAREYYQSMIVCADSPDEAQKLFDAWLHPVPEGDNPLDQEIKQMIAAQFMEKMLTESGHEPIDWTQISNRVEPTLESTAGDNLDQGCWADVNQLVRPQKLSADLESLKRHLPEDLRSGLNWSADRQFFFIVSVLSPRSAPAVPDFELEHGTANPDDKRGINSTHTEESELDAAETALPELADKEVVALVQARNSAVAAWLWRKFAAETKHAFNDIEIEPWCGLIAVEEGQHQPSEQA